MVGPFHLRFQLIAKHEDAGPSTPPTFWTIVEVTVAVVAACLPALAPLLKRLPTPGSIATSIRHVFSSQSTGKESMHLPEISPQKHEYRRQYSDDQTSHGTTTKAFAC